MSVLPKNIQEQIQFCETHIPVWTASPAKIGLTSAQVAELETHTEAAREAFNNAQAKRAASKGATTTLAGAVGTMRSGVADLLRQIKAYAALSADAATVYADAQIPEPAAPSPLPAPGKPTNFNVTLQSDGSVTLSWDATNSSASTGAFFNITRKLPGQNGFLPLGGAPGSTTGEGGRRASFTDATIPSSAASAGAQYIVQGFRGTRAGEPSDAMIVQFGSDGLGATVSAVSGIKLAA